MPDSTLPDLGGPMRAWLDPTSADLIRPDIRAALDAWGAGTSPGLGGFLSAMVCNDMMEAVGRADLDNLRAIPALCSYLYNRLPSRCWGSKEKAKSWAERHSMPIPEGCR